MTGTTALMNCLPFSPPMGLRPNGLSTEFSINVQPSASNVNSSPFSIVRTLVLSACAGEADYGRVLQIRS